MQLELNVNPGSNSLVSWRFSAADLGHLTQGFWTPNGDK